MRREVDHASRSVRQLGALIFEMEVLRSYLAQHELPFFDAKVIPAKTSALVAIHALQGQFFHLFLLACFCFAISVSNFDIRGNILFLAPKFILDRSSSLERNFG